MLALLNIKAVLVFTTFHIKILLNFNLKINFTLIVHTKGKIHMSK